MLGLTCGAIGVQNLTMSCSKKPKASPGVPAHCLFPGISSACASSSAMGRQKAT
jgi:hypothetical protein